MKVVFRVDASLEIGSGHVMRCLTIANEMKANKHETYFICRQHDGHMIDLIEASGHEVYKLPRVDGCKQDLEAGENDLYHAGWLGSTQLEDSISCQPFLNSIKPDWLIVDHYALDFRWQNALKPYYKKLMVIDDLADRKHSCDVLLDQTFKRKKKDYVSLVPETCQLLLGGEFAILRAEFAKWREYSLDRRNKNSVISRILINLGGVDQNNLTSEVLRSLAYCNISNDTKIIVVMGAQSPHLEKVKHLANSLPMNISIRCAVKNMAQIMSDSDLAIGAAGATTWERCCLGLPSIILVQAKNQEKIAESIAENSLAIVIRNISEIAITMKNMSKYKLTQLSVNSSMAIDGLGVQRLMGFIR